MSYTLPIYFDIGTEGFSFAIVLDLDDETLWVSGGKLPPKKSKSCNIGWLPFYFWNESFLAFVPTLCIFLDKIRLVTVQKSVV